MQHKTVTSPYSQLPDYPENDEYYYRRLNYEIDALKIDFIELGYFLHNQYQASKKPELKKEAMLKGINYKNTFDYKYVWFISAKRDAAWLFVPTDDTLEALSKPYSEFINYPLENDLRFTKNKKFIRRILTNTRDDTTFFDITKGEIFTPIDDDKLEWSDWYYDKFNPLESEIENLKRYGPYRCSFCGKFFTPRNYEQDCCNSQKCKQKNQKIIRNNKQKLYAENRKIKLSAEKKKRESDRLENPVRCHHCGGILPENARPNKKFCGISCRVSHHRKKKY